MDTIELTLDSSTAFKSADPNYSPTNNPEFYIPNGIQNIVGIKVLEVAIPCSWYTISEEIDPGSGRGMNNVIFTGPGLPGESYYHITIPVGNYTGPQLADQITTLMNSAAFTNILQAAFGSILLTYSDRKCVYNSINGAFTWSFTINDNYGGDLIDIQFYGYRNVDGKESRSKAATILGFKQDQTPFIGGTFSGGQQTWTLTSGVALVQGPPYISVNSNKLGNLIKISQNIDISKGQNNLKFTNQTFNSPVLAMIPLNVPQGGILTWQDPEKGTALPVENAFQIQSFDLYLTQGPFYKDVLDLNGLPFTIKFLIKTRQTQST